MQSTSQNLLWVKNVKYEKGARWAYMDAEHQDEFLLDFSKHWQKGADKPNVGDVILLFQTISIEGYDGTYLTHLVTPTTNQAKHTGNPAFPKARQIRVVARASLHNPIKMPDDLIFFKPNRGGCLPLNLIERVNGGSRHNGDYIPLGELQKIIWDLFEGYYNQ